MGRGKRDHKNTFCGGECKEPGHFKFAYSDDCFKIIPIDQLEPQVGDVFGVMQLQLAGKGHSLSLFESFGGMKGLSLVVEI